MSTWSMVNAGLAMLTVLALLAQTIALPHVSIGAAKVFTGVVVVLGGITIISSVTAIIVLLNAGV